jgi:hypothetical protein
VCSLNAPDGGPGVDAEQTHQMHQMHRVGSVPGLIQDLVAPQLMRVIPVWSKAVRRAK